jgi:hypothetical protein
MNSNALAWAKLIRCLLEGDCRVADLVEETGLSHLTIGIYLNYMRREGVAHVTTKEPDRNGRLLIKVWRLGDGKELAPPPQSREVKNAKLREKTRRARLAAVVQSPQ